MFKDASNCGVGRGLEPPPRAAGGQFGKGTELGLLEPSFWNHLLSCLHQESPRFVAGAVGSSPQGYLQIQGSVTSTPKAWK